MNHNMTPFSEQQSHLSISGEAFQVAVVVPSSDVHLIGVISSYKGSGADSPYLSVGEGNDAFGCAASKMGRGAFMMLMVSGPAVPAAPIVGAVAGLVPRILAVAPEAVDVGWEHSFVLPKGATRRGPWILYYLPLKTVFSFAVFWITVGGSLCCMDVRNDAARGGSGMSAKEVRDQARSDCRMCQVTLHLVLFLFSFELLSP